MSFLFSFGRCATCTREDLAYLKWTPRVDESSCSRCRCAGCAGHTSKHTCGECDSCGEPVHAGVGLCTECVLAEFHTRPLIEAVVASVRVQPTLDLEPCAGCGSVSCPTGGRCPDLTVDDLLEELEVVEEVADGEPF